MVALARVSDRFVILIGEVNIDGLQDYQPMYHHQSGLFERALDAKKLPSL